MQRLLISLRNPRLYRRYSKTYEIYKYNRKYLCVDDLDFIIKNGINNLFEKRLEITEKKINNSLVSKFTEFAITNITNKTNKSKEKPIEDNEDVADEPSVDCDATTVEDVADTVVENVETVVEATTEEVKKVAEEVKETVGDGLDDLD